MSDSKNNNISRECAAYVAGLRDTHLNDKIRDAAYKCFIDWMGCVLGGASTLESSIVRRYRREYGTVNGPSTVWGDTDKANVSDACFENACNGHILEMDDVHQAAVLHPAVAVISAAFALAEKTHSSGRTLLDAVTAGYDIMIRMGEAAGPTHYEIWHSTATCGAFGAAAAAANVLGLSSEQTLWALGNAGSQAAGLWEFADDGAMTKILHCGKAAMNGTMAAILASYGFTGASRIIEGPRGFLQATSKKPKYEAFDGLGERFAILETAFKPYAACRHTHSVVDAVINLRGRVQSDISDIRSISIETYPTARTVAGASRYDTPTMAKFNMRYCAARALLDGELGVRGFSADKLQDPRITELIGKIEVSVSPDIEAAYPERWPARVSVMTNSGVIREYVEYPSGDPRNPVSEEAMERKFMDLACLRVDRPTAERILRRCRSIFDSKDVASHFDMDTNGGEHSAAF